MDDCAYHELRWVICGEPETWAENCPCLERWLGDLERLYGDPA